MKSSSSKKKIFYILPLLPKECTSPQATKYIQINISQLELIPRNLKAFSNCVKCFCFLLICSNIVLQDKLQLLLQNKTAGCSLVTDLFKQLIQMFFMSLELDHYLCPSKQVYEWIRTFYTLRQSKKI